MAAGKAKACEGLPAEARCAHICRRIFRFGMGARRGKVHRGLHCPVRRIRVVRPVPPVFVEQDCIALFDEYGWDWTYHAFRESKSWNVEFALDANGKFVHAEDTPRKRALVAGLRGRSGWCAKSGKKE